MPRPVQAVFGSVRWRHAVGVAVGAGVLLIAWLGASTCRRPTGVELHRVELPREVHVPAGAPPGSPPDFPDDVQPGEWFLGQRRPHPDDPPPPPRPDEAALERWRAEVVSAIDRGAAWCGAEPLVLWCATDMCVAVGPREPGTSFYLGMYARRPMRLVEQVLVAVGLPEGIDRCAASARALSKWDDQEWHGVGDDLLCYGFFYPGSDGDGFAALCEEAARERDR